jgi:hypothetical protein
MELKEKYILTWNILIKYNYLIEAADLRTVYVACCLHWFIEQHKSLAVRAMIRAYLWQPLVAGGKYEAWRSKSNLKWRRRKMLLSYVMFQVLTAVLLTIQVFWDITPCRFIVTDVSKY